MTWFCGTNIVKSSKYFVNYIIPSLKIYFINFCPPITSESWHLVVSITSISPFFAVRVEYMLSTNKRHFQQDFGRLIGNTGNTNSSLPINSITHQPNITIQNRLKKNQKTHFSEKFLSVNAILYDLFNRLDTIGCNICCKDGENFHLRVKMIASLNPIRLKSQFEWPAPLWASKIYL